MNGTTASTAAPRGRARTALPPLRQRAGSHFSPDRRLVPGSGPRGGSGLAANRSTAPPGRNLARIPALGDLNPAREEVPRLRVRNFSVASMPRGSNQERSAPRKPGGHDPWRADKSTGPLFENQDKMLGVTNFGTHSSGTSGGVEIEVDASTAGTTAKSAAAGAGLGAGIGLGAGLVGLGIAGILGATLGGGLIAGALLGGLALGALVGGLIGGLSGEYRYTQTIDTNVPLGGTTSPYVDPRPNDDDKPFYYTDAEHKEQGTKFYDRPSRGVPSTGTTRWDAVLSITKVIGKSVSILESLKYGFSLDTAGTVTARAPASTTSVGTHISTLSSEFPDWTFKRD